MDKCTCGVCGRKSAREYCHIIKLTEAEREQLLSQIEPEEVEPEKEYIFCKPCWTTLSDPEAGPMYGKGLIQQRLRQFGVGNAEEIANRFHAKLVDRINKPKPS